MNFKKPMMHLFVKVNWSCLFQGRSVIRLPFLKDALMMSRQNSTKIEEFNICNVVGLCIKFNCSFRDLLLWVMSLMLCIRLLVKYAPNNGTLKRLWSNKVNKNVFLSIMKTESKKNLKDIISPYSYFPIVHLWVLAYI